MLVFHIIAGSFVLLFGILALSAPKISNIHKWFGRMFLLSVLMMAASALFLSDDPTIPITSIYFSATSWATVLRPEKKIKKKKKIAFIVIVILTTRYFVVALSTGSSFMSTMFFIFGSISLLAALLDLNMILRGGLSGAQRIARHLWRMIYALSGAVLSFAANTSNKWPEFINEYGPNYFLIAIMLFWLIRVHFTKWFENNRRDIEYVS